MKLKVSYLFFVLTVIGTKGTRCRRYISDGSYGFAFNLTEGNFKNIKSSNGEFEMHIHIQGSGNAYVYLGPKPRYTLNAYESAHIVGFGTASNNIIDLQALSGSDIVTVSKVNASNNILSATEFRAFYIKISKDGVIEVGREDNAPPIMRYYDPSYVVINCFTFRSSNRAIFLYDCPAPGSNNHGSQVSPVDTSTSSPNFKPQREADQNNIVVLSDTGNDKDDITVKISGAGKAVNIYLAIIGNKIENATQNNSVAWFPIPYLHSNCSTKNIISEDDINLQTDVRKN